jgi:hypothetical protein
MKAKSLLPDPSVLKFQRIIPSDEVITIELRTSQPQASCPVCQQASRKVHSRSQSASTFIFAASFVSTTIAPAKYSLRAFHQLFNAMRARPAD